MHINREACKELQEKTHDLIVLIMTALQGKQEEDLPPDLIRNLDRLGG